MEIEATKGSILATLDYYQNEHPDPINYMFDEFKVIEIKREREPDINSDSLFLFYSA
jgi:hypothetical protein